MNNLTDVLQCWLQGQINDAVAGHSSRIAYLEGFVSSLSERLEKGYPNYADLSSRVERLNQLGSELLKRVTKLDQAYSDMATMKDLQKDTNPSVLADKMHEYIEQVVDDKLGECVKEVHLEENVEAILDRRSQASDDDKRDAQRYRWLREQHLNDNFVGVVRHPEEVLKFGTVCYSGASSNRLIDEALAKEQA